MTPPSASRTTTTGLSPTNVRLKSPAWPENVLPPIKRDLARAKAKLAEGGKAGGFVAYQHRGLRGTNFVHLIPSVAFYLPQANLNLWYSQPVSGASHGGNRTEYGINKLQATASFFAGSDWFGPYLRKDNVELVGGVQLNTFAGTGHNSLDGAGFGPVVGMSFLPMPGVAVNLVRATFDHEGRYKVSTGLEFFVDRKGNTTLKEARRKYLEPNQDGSQGAGKHELSHNSDCRRKC